MNSSFQGLSREVAAKPARESGNGDFKRFSVYLERESGISLGDNKEYLVKSRLGPLMRELGLENLEQLMDQLERRHDLKLKARVVDDMTTNETQWFRDVHPFEILIRNILPAVSARRQPSLRIWSAACSTGQEPYSISMAIDEYRLRNPGALPATIEIIGTDISPSVLQTAQDGIYTDLALARGLSQERRRSYFQANGGSLQLLERIRNPVRFRQLNLLEGFAALGRVDIIFCRNVFIYFTQDRKLDILQRMTRVLKPEGVLFLGASESLPSGCSSLSMVRHGGGMTYSLNPRS